MSFFSSISQVADYLNLPAAQPVAFDPTYHRVAQSFSHWPVVIREDDTYKIKLFEWGLIAGFMNTPEKIKEYRSSMANARSEKIIADPRSVWHRIRQQRCLVCCTGFFEHRDIGAKRKIPYFITVRDQPVFSFAGLYHDAPVADPDTGEVTGTFAIITRPANSLLKKIHNSGANKFRMPLLLTKDLALQWLKEKLTDFELSSILQFEFPAEEMQAWPVQSIRTRKADDTSVIEPLHDPSLPPLED